MKSLPLLVSSAILAFASNAFAWTNLDCQTLEGDSLGRLVAAVNDLTTWRDPARRYVERRSLKTVRSIAGTDTGLAKIAERASAIGGNDGWVNLADIDFLATDANSALLFPEEKQALLRLQELFEVPEAVTEIVLNEPMLRYQREPGTSKIAELPPSLREAASRLQLVANDDGDPSTITIADLDRVPEFAAGLTDASERDLAKVRKWTAEHVVGVWPGASMTHVFIAGANPATDVSLELVSRPVSRAGYTHPHWSVPSPSEFKPHTTTKLSANSPNGQRVVMTKLSGEIAEHCEVVLGTARATEGQMIGKTKDEIALPSMEVLIEVFSGSGFRTSSQVVKIVAPAADHPVVERGMEVVGWRNADGSHDAEPIPPGNSTWGPQERGVRVP